MSEFVAVDDLRVEVRRSGRRKTVDLTVDRAGGLVIAVPESLEQPEIGTDHPAEATLDLHHAGSERRGNAPRSQEEIRDRGRFLLLARSTGSRCLTLLTEKRTFLTFVSKNGRFLLRAKVTANGRDHFIEWYSAQGRKWIVEAAAILIERVAAAPRRIGIRDLGFRWGSCSAQGDVYFHWRTMLLPPHVVHYLIQHELIHLHEHHHGPAFYARLARVVPEYDEIEKWLEKNGGIYHL